MREFEAVFREEFDNLYKSEPTTVSQNIIKTLVDEGRKRGLPREIVALSIIVGMSAALDAARKKLKS